MPENDDFSDEKELITVAGQRLYVIQINFIKTLYY
jgi:hypothetical protein